MQNSMNFVRNETKQRGRERRRRRNRSNELLWRLHKHLFRLIIEWTQIEAYWKSQFLLRQMFLQRSKNDEKNKRKNSRLMMIVNKQIYIWLFMLLRDRCQKWCKKKNIFRSTEIIKGKINDRHSKTIIRDHLINASASLQRADILNICSFRIKTTAAASHREFICQHRNLHSLIFLGSWKMCKTFLWHRQ